MEAFKDQIINKVYAIDHPPRTREKPMAVIAVGISRSGTESLRQALHALGIEHTWHGFDSVLPPYCLQEWYKLAVKKWNTVAGGNHLATEPKVSRQDFDRIIGHCAGITDLPAAAFARELIAAYPEAKVILNTRTDLADWQLSFGATMGVFDRNPVDWDWCKSWFCAELFWVRQYMARTQLPVFFRGSFASNGVWVYEEHAAMIRGLRLPRERLLEWSAEDGWEPICHFLDKPVPIEPFPQGNPPAQWADRIALTMQEYHKRAVRNMIIVVTIFAGLILWSVVIYTRATLV